MSTVNPNQVSEYAQRDGYNAARALQPIQSVEQYLQTHPEVANGDDQDREIFRSTFRNRYNQTVSEMGAAGISYNGKSPAQVADEIAKVEAAKKTVTEWEQEANIPNWSVAKAVASNFDVDVQKFQARVVANAGATKTPEGALWGTRYASFYTQWKTLYAQIQAQAGSLTPSSSVARVREARMALVSMMLELDALIAKAGTPGVSKDVYVVPPPAKTPVTPAMPPIGAKAKIPAWGIVAALATAGAGVWYFFFKKKSGGPKLLPPGAMR